MPGTRRPSPPADEDAVSRMEHEGGPDPEVAELKKVLADREKELSEYRAATEERIKRASDSAKLETRPSIKSAVAQSDDYSVEAEIRALWPEA